MIDILHWLAVHAGVSDESSPYYAFWSGFGSDISEVAILGGMASLYRRHTCHEPGCWRLGRHPVAGTEFTACRKHHPELPSAGHMTTAWQAAKNAAGAVKETAKEVLPVGK